MVRSTHYTFTVKMTQLQHFSPGITLIGLGPGDPALLTRQAWELLQSATEVYVRDRRHPALQILSPGAAVHGFEPQLAGADGQAAQQQVVEQLLALARSSPGLLYAVPGHPLSGDALAASLLRQAQAAGLPVRVVAGLSLLESAAELLGIEALARASLVDVLTILPQHAPCFPPDAPALIHPVQAGPEAAAIQKILQTVYPPAHPLHWLPYGAAERSFPLSDLALALPEGEVGAVYVPALGPATSFEGFQEVIAHLRAPEGCPWDREQTHLSLRPYLLQEAYEVLDALDANDMAALHEELGDLLLQIVLHAQIASEAGSFRMTDVIHAIHSKLVRRHPHVFSDTQIQGVGDVLQNWEMLKAAERKKKGKERNSALDGVPVALPALTLAGEYQQRVIRFGFQWQTPEQVFDKIQEELGEVQRAQTIEEKTEEIGDLLMTIVTLARWFEVDPESALRSASVRFRCRFQYLEETARRQGRALSEMPLEEMLSLWRQAKPGCE